MDQLIGIDLGGTQIKCGLFEANSGELLEKTILPTNDSRKSAVAPVWATTIREVIQSWDIDRCLPTGLASPGMPSVDGKSMTGIPGRMYGLESFQWTSEMNWKSPIPVINDAHAALLGEIW